MYEDLTGQRYGRLVIAERYYCTGSKRNRWRAQCDCGKIKEGIDVSNWKYHRYSSCGCNTLPDINIGARFHDWTVVSKSNEGRKLYSCICSCGNKSSVSKVDLLYGKSKRCMACSHKMAIRPNFQAAMNSVVRNYKRQAHKRNLVWEIDNIFAQLITSTCHYCGIGPSSCITTSNASFWYNGIDRVDNNRGYEIDNVVTCCGICNYAKRSMRYDHFINWLNRVVDFRGKGVRRDRDGSEVRSVNFAS